MICCSITNRSKAEILNLLNRVEMAELRLDLCQLDTADIEEIFLHDTPLVATCRAVDGDFHRTERELLTAIEAGAQYADLEIDAPGSVARRVRQVCREYGTVMIRSFHDFDGCPDPDTLRSIVDRCRNMGGEIVKIAVTATSEQDVERVMSLYKYYEPSGLIAFAMGETGAPSRLECLAKGAPFSYACADASQATAPGQMPYSVMYEKVYGTSAPMTPDAGASDAGAPDAGVPVYNAVVYASAEAPLRMPSSKSYAQRAIIAAALADGISVLRGYTPCEDSEAAIGVARALGATVTPISEGDGPFTLEIKGRGTPAQPSTAGCFQVGESGLLARLMIPLSAQIHGAEGADIEGSGTLLLRPLEGAGATMRMLGATMRIPEATMRKPGATTGTSGAEADGQGGDAPLSADSACPGDIQLPLHVAGPLRGGRFEIDGRYSSQLISGLLMALPLCARNSTLMVRNPVSIPYIYMTMEILRKFGIRTRSEMFGGSGMLERGWRDCDSLEIRIKENQRYRSCDISLEADWSAAAVFLAAGAIFGSVRLEGLDTSSIQADIMMLDILMEAGASLSQEDEPRGVVTVRKSPLRAFDADLSNSPDLFPVAAVLCAFCQGKSRLKGVGRLAHKESDRAKAILAMLGSLGVKASVEKDVMSITGESFSSRRLTGHLLKGGSFTSSHDHRMVMALRLAEMGSDSPITIDDEQCVSKSFPGFALTWKQMKRQ